MATVIPEIGLDDEPISPVRRDDTVTNKKPNNTMRNAPIKFICSDGAKVIAAINTMTPIPTHFSGISFCVRNTDVVSPLTR